MTTNNDLSAPTGRPNAILTNRVYSPQAMNTTVTWLVERLEATWISTVDLAKKFCQAAERLRGL